MVDKVFKRLEDETPQEEGREVTPVGGMGAGLMVEAAGGEGLVTSSREREGAVGLPWLAFSKKSKTIESESSCKLSLPWDEMGENKEEGSADPELSLFED